jgi:hypothetical protein
MMKNRPIHYNHLQLDVALVNANQTILVWPRGEGKTTVLAHRLVSNFEQMPRSLTAIVTPTYTQLLKNTLPALKHGLSRLGYIEGYHYYFGSYAPKHKRWEYPFYKPLKTEHIFHWHNGATAQLVSQDVTGSANGPSYDGGIGDELKFINKEKLDHELFPAFRANEEHFGKCSLHHGFMGCTDMPMQSDGAWIFAYEDEVNLELIMALRTLQTKRNHYLSKILKNNHQQSSKLEYKKRIRKIDRLINELNKGFDDLEEEYCRPPAVYYSEPKGTQILANLNALTPKYYRRQRRWLSDLAFSMAIMNERHAKVENGFYPDLEPSYHGYLMHDNHYMMSIDHTKDSALADIGDDCRSDGDVNKYEPLLVAPDFGVSFNCCVVGQMFTSEFRLLKDFYVRKPLKIRHVVEQFANYYEHMHCKHIMLIHDSTAVAETAINNTSYIDEWQRELEAKGWTVTVRNYGRTPTYKDRYDLWHFVLSELDDRIPVFRYNKKNAESWANSCELAPVKISAGKIEKDKSSEKPGKDQLVATHLSEAGDVLIYHSYKGIVQNATGIVTDVMPL